MTTNWTSFSNVFSPIKVDCFEYDMRFAENSNTSRVHYTKSGSVEDCQDKCNLQRKRPKKKGELCEVWSWNEVKEECDMFSNKNGDLIKEQADGFVKGPYDCKFDRDRDEEKHEEDDDE